jgi:hypothetical protein
VNHTERIHHVARQVRGLTRDLAREAVERYLASLGEEAARGEWVTLPSIGRIKIVTRSNGGRLAAHIGGGTHSPRRPGTRLQACLRMSESFKALCREHTPAAPRNDTDVPLRTPGRDRK